MYCSQDYNFTSRLNSSFWLQQFLHLPFLLVCRQDIFKLQKDQICEYCEGVIDNTDDINVHGYTKKEHDVRLCNMIEVTHEHGLLLNKTKCAVKANSIKFLYL